MPAAFTRPVAADQAARQHAIGGDVGAEFAAGGKDFRLDAAGRPHFLECNPLPGLHPENSDLVLLSRASLSYEKLVQGVAVDAARRLGLSLP